MKIRKHISKIVIAMVLAMTVIFTALPTVSAAALLPTDKVSFTMKCSHPGYTFNVYRIASLDTSSSNPYETKYTSLIPDEISGTQVSEDIENGDSASLLNTLDAIETIPNTLKVDTWTSTTSITSKTVSNKDQGVYYVRTVNFPANVSKVTNSVFALPYFDNNGWAKKIADIDVVLADKVAERQMETHKSITNSTLGEDVTDYTDVSIGDEVDFAIKSNTMGSNQMKLNSYIVSDVMSKGLTLDETSFVVTLLDSNNKTIKTLDASDYTVNVTQKTTTDTVQDTIFTVSLNKSWLASQTDVAGDFYNPATTYTLISYSATLNKNAVVGVTGNPNTESKIEYSNKTDVKAEVPGNTVYVYTYGIKTNKTNPEGTALEGATFQLFKTESDATALRNVIATGVSDSKGIVEYKNAKDEIMRLQSGTYYVVETKAPAGYNVYGKVIEVNIDAEYGDTLANGTYVTNSPKDGVATFNVINTRLVAPKTGGYGNTIAYVIGGVLVAGGLTALLLALLKKRQSKKSH